MLHHACGRPRCEPIVDASITFQPIFLEFQIVIMELEARIQQAVLLLQDLTRQDESSESGTKRSYLTSNLPAHEIQRAAGVAFLFSSKAALGITASKGHGFVLAKVEGSPGWSAPLLFSVFAGGLGISIGYAEVATLTILDTKEAVLEFLKPQVSLDSHLSVAAGSRLAGDASESAINLTAPRLSLKKFSYSVNKGVMIDASWNGASITVNDEDQQKIYGPGVTKLDVISGLVKPPQYTMEVYKALNRIQFVAQSTADILTGLAAEVPEGQF